MSFANERPIKAIRKARPCCGCGIGINAGQPAIVWSGMTDGDFHSVTYHPECREAEIALNRLQKTCWYDEWTALGDHDPDDWQWLLDEYPVVAARFGITAERIAEHKAERERVRQHFSRASPTLSGGNNAKPA